MLDLMHNNYFKEASFERVKRLKAAGIPVDEYDESKYPIEAPVSPSQHMLKSLKASSPD